MLEKLRYRISLRSDYDAEWAGEVGTFVWKTLARGKSKEAAAALHACERANRIALAEALRESGSRLTLRNPLIVAPAALAGAAAALTPMPIHRAIYTSRVAINGVRRAFGAKARRFEAPLYHEVGERHVEAFRAFA